MKPILITHTAQCAALIAPYLTGQSVGHAEFQSNWRCLESFLLGVPFSKLSGDHEADVAKWKGEVGAIETAQIKHKCMVASVQKTQSNDKDAQPHIQAQTTQPASGKN